MVENLLMLSAAQMRLCRYVGHFPIVVGQIGRKRASPIGNEYFAVIGIESEYPKLDMEVWRRCNVRAALALP